MAGAEGAAGGALAAAGPIAAAVGAAIAIGQAEKKILGDLAAGAVDVVTSFAQFRDGSQGVHDFGAGLKSVGDKVWWISPMIGTLGAVAGETTMAIARLDDAVKSTAQRLGQYNAGLATQNAAQEVAELMRDINRAQRFGQGAQDANEWRFAMEQKFADITDRLMPLALKISEFLFGFATGFMTTVDETLKLTLRVADGQPRLCTFIS